VRPLRIMASLALAGSLSGCYVYGDPYPYGNGYYSRSFGGYGGAYSYDNQPSYGGGYYNQPGYGGGYDYQPGYGYGGGYGGAPGYGQGYGSPPGYGSDDDGQRDSGGSHTLPYLPYYGEEGG
jgi:hypothetical protein